MLAREEALVDTQASIEGPEFKQAVDAMQTGTRQYARRQIKWIRNQLLPVIEASKADGRMDDVYLYLLDATGKFDSTRVPPILMLLAHLIRCECVVGECLSTRRDYTPT